MKASVRWLVAGIVVLAAFAIPTWLCGAFILTGVLTDPGVRWTVAASAGLALSALATLWGLSFAKQEGETETGTAKAASGKVKNTISARGGIYSSSINQGRDIIAGNSGKPASERAEEEDK